MLLQQGVIRELQPVLLTFCDCVDPEDECGLLPAKR